MSDENATYEAIEMLMTCDICGKAEKVKTALRAPDWVVVGDGESMNHADWYAVCGECFRKTRQPDFESWLAEGIANGFCSPQVCATHSGIPSVDDEDAEDDRDFCVHVVRLGTEAEWQAEIDSFRESRAD